MTYSMIVGKYKLIFSDTHFKDFRKKPTISVYDADTNSETKIASFNSQETFEWFVEAVVEADRKTEPQTSGVVWTEDAIKNEPKAYTTWASTDEPRTDCPFGEDDKCFGCGDNTKCIVFDEPQTERSE